MPEQKEQQGHRTTKVAVDIEYLKRDMGEMKELLSKVVDAINHIGVLNERIASVSNTSAELSSRLSAIERQQQVYTIESETNKARISTVSWLVRGAWAVVATVVLSAAYYFGGGGKGE